MVQRIGQRCLHQYCGIPERFYEWIGRFDDAVGSILDFDLFVVSLAKAACGCLLEELKVAITFLGGVDLGFPFRARRGTEIRLQWIEAREEALGDELRRTGGDRPCEPLAASGARGTSRFALSAALRNLDVLIACAGPIERKSHCCTSLAVGVTPRIARDGSRCTPRCEVRPRTGCPDRGCRSVTLPLDRSSGRSAGAVSERLRRDDVFVRRRGSSVPS